MRVIGERNMRKKSRNSNLRLKRYVSDTIKTLSLSGKHDKDMSSQSFAAYWISSD